MIKLNKLVWTEQNKEHIARHDVTREEVEEVCHNNPVELYGHSGRIMLVGLSKKGKAISIVLDPVSEGVWYPVTARSADKKERRYYETKK